jgi:tRNA(Ile)-lysidine synthase
MICHLTNLVVGIKSRTVKILWPSNPKPVGGSNFESLARIHRYQNLAYVSLEEGINSLFLGHHLSDQVETIISRLIRGHGFITSGLIGMKAVNDIPCCQSILGAFDGHDISSLSKPRRTMSTPRFIIQEGKIEPEHASAAPPVVQRSSFSDSILMSNPGVKICRPLLSFDKPRLIKTCEINGVPYVNDPSNLDPKTTNRNAIRYLLSNNKMPKALRQESILGLAAASARLLEARSETLIKLIKATQLIRVDLRSGRLVVLVPEDITRTYDATEPQAALYVSRLLRLISPSQQKSYMQHTTLARWIFPELLKATHSTLNCLHRPSSCTAGNVLVERLDGPPGRLLELTRRPFKAGEDPIQGFVPAPFYYKGSDRDWSKWSVWDSRYWFRIRTRDPEEVRRFSIRALRVSDLRKLNNTDAQVCTDLQRRLKTVLHEAAPGMLRYRLPVLMKGDDLRALPTLDIGLPVTPSSPSLADELQWEARYINVSETLKHMAGLHRPDCGPCTV